MIVAVPREIAPGEKRVALVPEGVKQLVGKGIEVAMETAAGEGAGIPDDAFRAAGARIEEDAVKLLAGADVVLKVEAPEELPGGGHEVDRLRSGAALLATLRPYDRPDLAARLAARGVTSFSLELMPRITRAQSMDVLSSMSTIAGYHAVLIAATQLPRLFPMLVTAAGTLTPARVLIVGAGVAGLQAIATARRLGAVVEAYDTRPAVKEQVQSLGARFVELPIAAADAEDKSGYAKAQSEEFYQKQRALLAERVCAADVVITTALVPGQPAPKLIDAETVSAMRPGSVIVDLAAERGGNCALTQPGRDVRVGDVTVCGPLHLPSRHPYHASQLFARNVITFLLHLVKDGALQVDTGDEITRGTLLTHGGEITNESVKAKAAAA